MADTLNKKGEGRKGGDRIIPNIVLFFVREDSWNKKEHKKTHSGLTRLSPRGMRKRPYVVNFLQLTAI